MFGFLKLLPFLMLAAGAAWFYHYTTINAKQEQIDKLNYDLQVSIKESATLRAAEATNIQTIESLRKKGAEQAQMIGSLTARSNALTAERDAYVSIFKRHNLTKLARAKPGLIEPDANKRTAEVFRSVEAASREVENADNTDTNNNNSDPSS